MRSFSALTVEMPLAAKGRKEYTQAMNVLKELANELADFIHQEHDALILAAFIQVLLHPLGEAFDIEAKVVFEALHPSVGIFDFLPKGL